MTLEHSEGLKNRGLYQTDEHKETYYFSFSLAFLWDCIIFLSYLG